MVAIFDRRHQEQKKGGLKVTTTAITPTTTHRASSPVNATNPFAVLVETIRSMLKRMTPDQVRDIAVLQVQRLLVLLYEALKERERAVRAENNLAILKALLGQTRNTSQAVSTTVVPSGGNVTSSGEVTKATMAALSRTTNGTNVSATTAPATISVITVGRSTPGNVAASSSTAVDPTATAGQSTIKGPTEPARPPTATDPILNVRPPTAASPTETAGPSTVADSTETARQSNPTGSFSAGASTAASVTSSIRPASATSVHRTTDSVESTSVPVGGYISTAALLITETTAGKNILGGITQAE